jgi:DNA-binding NarL/FixJ family response regulator
MTAYLDKPIDIILVDDSVEVRRSIGQLLNSAPDIDVIAEFEDAVRLLESLTEGLSGMVVMDFNMPEVNGILAIKRIKKISSDVNVIVMSFNDDYRYIQSSIKAGASGYVLKENAYEELPVAIREVSNNKIYLSKHHKP